MLDSHVIVWIPVNKDASVYTSDQLYAAMEKAKNIVMSDAFNPADYINVFDVRCQINGKCVSRLSKQELAQWIDERDAKTEAAAIKRREIEVLPREDP